MQFRPFAASVILALPAVLVATPAAGQDVQYETVSKIEFAGAFGRVMRVAQRMSGGSSESVQTTYLKGNRMRVDADQSSTITDLDGKRMIFLDHKEKTYTIMTFEEAIAAARKAASDMSAANNEARSTGPDRAETELTFRFSVDRPNETQQVAGYRASRVFITAEMEGEYTPEGATEREKGGTLAVLTDMWTSTDIPAFKALNTFQEASAREYAEAGSAIVEGFAAAFADDPQVKVAFQKSAAEAKKIDGMAVRTATMFVAVAPDQKLDRALATAPPRQGPSVTQQAVSAGLGRFARAAAGAAGVSASGAGNANQQADAADPNAKQVTMFTVTSEIRNVSTRSLDASLFAPPSGYREVKRP